jgi:hypothetical protein
LPQRLRLAEGLRRAEARDLLVSDLVITVTADAAAGPA